MPPIRFKHLLLGNLLWFYHADRRKKFFTGLCFYKAFFYLPKRGIPCYLNVVFVHFDVPSSFAFKNQFKMAEILQYSIAGLISILITAWIFSLVFNARATLNLLRAQVKLLEKIAEKSGVSSEDIKTIITVYYPKE